MLVGEALGHMSSEVNLARSRRLQEDGTEEESVNAKWQCEVDEVKQPASPSRTMEKTESCVRDLACWIAHGIPRLHREASP